MNLTPNSNIFSKRTLITAASILLFCMACNQENTNNSEQNNPGDPASDSYLVVLGNVQDGGSPHIGCIKECCKDLFTSTNNNRKVVSLGLVDPSSQKKFMIEASPDFVSQAHRLHFYCPFENPQMPDGIFLTHAHIGHYTGLMYLGKEALGAHEVPVFAMPGMKTFLENNGPWDQLVYNRNIELYQLLQDSSVHISESFTITPFMVPHRDEYSETVGYRIEGPKKSALFIPDIDKWEKWDRDITEEIENVDFAFIDGTFFNGNEINHRDISEIPHPFIIESMSIFSLLPETEKSKIHFIHLNHTNPLLDPESEESNKVIEQGFRIARIGMKFEL